MEGMEERLGAAGYHLLLSGSDCSRQEARSVSLITQGGVDAAIMLGAFPFKQIEPLSKVGVPFLLLDSDLDELPIDSVTTDGFSAGRMVVENLHAHGHRRILMLAYNLDDYNIDARVHGFLTGLKQFGLSTKDA